jgi:sugar phosphate isomerase/epimerase
MANPIGRVFPLHAEEFDYAPFLGRLREIGYAGNISLEATTGDLAKEGPQSMAFLRNGLTSK